VIALLCRNIGTYSEARADGLLLSYGDFGISRFCDLRAAAIGRGLGAKTFAGHSIISTMKTQVEMHA
jgi:hypothetical protein